MSDYQGALATLKGVAHGLRLGGREAPGDMIDEAITDIEATVADLVKALEKIAERDVDGLEMYTPQAMNAVAIAALDRVRRQP